MKEGESMSRIFNRDFYLGGFYKIGDLSPAQMAQIETGDFTPVTRQLSALAEGKERDALVLKLDQEVGQLILNIDSALGVATEHKDQNAVASLQIIIEKLNALNDEIRSFNSGK